MKKFFAVSALQVLTLVPMMAYSAAPAPSRGETALTQVVENDENEMLLADTFSRTLYTFDMDNGVATSKCDGTCAEVWPPLLVQQAEAAKLQSPLGVVVRSNKSLQLTFDGKPIYTYAFDRKAGDDHGDGIGGVWHYIEIK